MNLLKKIKDEEYFNNKNKLKLRRASRAILFDENNLIPLLLVSKQNYHKLPGGGIDEGENKKEALVRECLEEVGSTIEIKGKVGIIIEYRPAEKFDSKWDLKQTSYCYYGKVLSKGKPNFTESELENGFEIIWLSLKDAIKTLEEDTPKNFEGFFILKRDLTFLKEIKKILEKEKQ